MRTTPRIRMRCFKMSKEGPLRICISCRKKKKGKELLHLCYNNGLPLLNAKTKNGRGLYLCRDEKCVEKCFKKNLLKQGFRANPDETVIKELKQALLTVLKEQTEE